jgi:predicted phosphodiesterase
MKVNLISDLHLEFGDLELPGGEVLIIAGDACESRTLSKHPYDPGALEESSGRRPDRAARFFWEECTKYQHVLYVMGNHEHYHGKFNRTAHELRACLPKKVQLLEQDTVIIDDVVFLGATMWTDCNRGCPVTMETLKSGMNDYRVITWDGGGYRKLHPRDTAKIHQQTKDWLRGQLSEHQDRKVVVITHHAPSDLSIAPPYRNDLYLNGGYRSDLSDLILDHPQIRYWVHGHTHDPFDYAIGDTRVRCNPRGYVGHESRPDEFDPSEGFDV